MLSKKLPLLLPAAALFAALSGPAMAQDEDARRAILQMRTQLQMANQSRTELNNKVQDLQNQIAKLQGQVETLNHKLKQGLQNAASQQQAAEPPEPTPQVGDPDQQEAYDAGLDLFRQGSYQDAADALNGFANQYPKSPLTPNALFYAGSSQYATKDFQGAINTLEKITRNYPKSDKAGDALLVVAGSQLEMDDIDGSKATLQKVVQTYPDTPAADTAAERLKMYK